MPARTATGAKRPSEPRRRATARRRGEPTRDSPKARRAWMIAVEWAVGARMQPERRPWMAGVQAERSEPTALARGHRYRQGSDRPK
ncbi:hypothetical protein FHS27_006467 [Rhodopirellula rubra]|uniref:Uncharacterized protein n=1 Tax=Aporhodopirellula rubra TaxID=980271 RepID=A0A7W5E6G6_9BACT|nr:hypothetical protein [Aporhodopirellula rubra]MBB3210619.1 hypothetical protein [Aporhodopirellula rubra]